MVRSARYKIKMPLQIKTPAIISWDSKLQPIGLYDEITLRKLDERKIQLKKTKGYKIPTNDLNPVFQVAIALQSLRPTKFGVSIEIQKNIPTFSGLNSKLSNAAGVLLALNKLWKFNLDKKELFAIAKKVDQTLEKIVKQLYSLPNIPPTKNILFIRPKYININANWIMRKSAFDYFPDLKAIEKAISKNGATEYGITGNGPTLFGFFKEKPNSENIQKQFKDKIDFIWVGKTCNGAFNLLN